MMRFLPVCEPMLAGNELKYVTDAVSSGWISSAGSYVTAFEQAFADYCGVRHGIAVCNGTVALHLALRALGVGPGDEVIIPDFTMIASALAVCYCGAKPVFVDADPATWNMDAAAVERRITPATRGIMAVHIFGNPCDMDALDRLAGRHGLWLMEDAAEAHGARHKGRKAGGLSRIAAFSFFANKNITTGEGGMVVTDDDELAAACRYFKNMCFPLDAPRTYLHADIGYNYRMSNITAGIGRGQMKVLPLRVQQKQAIFARYCEKLQGLPLTMQSKLDCAQPNRWLSVLLLNADCGVTPAELLARLNEANIEGRHLWKPMSLQPVFAGSPFVSVSDAPVCDDLFARGVCLPSDTKMSMDDVDRVCEVIRGMF